MDALERATRGPAYDVGADPSEPGWVATRKARSENERARMGSVDLGSENRRDPASCRVSSLGGPISRCD
jgi:hypothetical protein